MMTLSRPPRGLFARGGQDESCLAALIAHTAPEEVNRGGDMDVALFMESDRVSAPWRRMRAADQEATPLPGPHSLESDALSPLAAVCQENFEPTLQPFHWACRSIWALAAEGTRASPTRASSQVALATMAW